MKRTLPLFTCLFCLLVFFDSCGQFYFYASQIGGEPLQISQFRSDYGVATDAAGNVYVTDAVSNLVKKFDAKGNPLLQWGSYGSGDGQLNSPHGVAVDASGNVYVADTYNHRIQKFNSTGTFITKWGTFGSGDGQFNSPFGVTVDGSGNVYVVENNNVIQNNRIQKFSSTGTFIAKWGNYGSGNEQFDSPHGVAVDASGNVYVADTNNDRIQKFSSTGNFIAKWGNYGSGDGQFNSPYGVVVDASGNVYVADTYNNRIQKFSSTGTYITKWGSGLGNGQFYSPHGVAVDASGNVYVADTNNDRIQKFSSTGNFITKWGSYGSGDGQFNSPYGVVVDGSGNVYVADTYNNRIQKFSSTGTFITKWGSSGLGDGQFSSPSGVAADGSGNVYVADTYNNRIQKFSSTGTYITKWGSGLGNGQFYSPHGVAVDASGNVYVADTNNDRIQKFSSTGNFITKWGSYGSGDGQFNSPYGVVVDGSGNVYVADTYNNRIQKFSSTGTFITKWGSSGSGDGQFSSPSGVTVDGSGNVYVADTYNNRIQKFSSTGTYITKWGSSGLGDGQFSSPSGVAVDGNGNVYVVDVNNYRIQKFNSTGTFIIKWGRSGSGDGLLNSPYGVAVDGNGNVYVADTNNNRIQKFSSTTGDLFTGWGSYGASDGKFRSPHGVAVDGNGNVYVADTYNHRIQKFAMLEVTSFSPLKAAVGGTVTITGKSFSTVASENSVSFNGVNATIAGATATSLTVTVPSGATTGTISVSRSGYTALSPNEFLSLPFAITSFSPGIGDAGTSVTITGTGFSSVAGNNVVKFNGVMATVTQNTATQLKATVPPGGLNGKITITTAGETTTSASSFDLLTLTGFSPARGTSGSAVTLTGTGLTSEATVKFNGVAGVVTNATGTSLTATVPANVTTGKITVTRESTTLTSTNEFLSLPFQITSFHPSVAMLGNVVTITGSGFSSVNANNLVKFNEETAVVIESSPTQIKTIVPSNATSGKISITVEGQTASSAIDFKITRLAVTDKNFPAYYTVGSASADVTITVNDINELQAVRFISKGITASENTLKTDNIVLASSKTLAFSIPSSYFNDPIGLAGYFILTDKEGNEIVSEKGYTYINYPGSVSTHTIPNLVFGKSVKNYQIFSIPLKLKNNLVSDVFDELGDYDNTKWRLYSHDGTYNSEMNSSSKIDAGIGYWLIIKDETIINPGEGNTVAVTEEEPFIITLSSGQNLIGNPYNFDVSWSDVLAFNNNPKAVGNLIQYNDGVIAESDLLKRYCGAFVRNTSNTSIAIKIPVKSNSTGGRKSSVAFAHNSIDSDSWMVRLILEDASLKNELGGFGMHPEAEYNEDQWDETTFPFPGVSGFKLVMKELPEKILVRDVVKSADEHTWAGQITSKHGVTLRWDNSYFGNNDKQLVMEINNRIELIDMRTTAELRLPAGKQNFSIHYGDDAYIKESTLTEKTGVGMVYPNPMKRSSEVLSIPSALPQGISEINLSLIDMMGKTATRSSEANYNEGRQTIEWKNDFTILSSGVYLVKISIKTASGSSNFYRKVIIE